MVNRDIFMGHTSGRKPLLKASPNGFAVKGKDTRHRCYGLLDRVDYQTRHIRIDDLWYRTCAEGEHPRPSRLSDPSHSDRRSLVPNLRGRRALAFRTPSPRS